MSRRSCIQLLVTFITLTALALLAACAPATPPLPSATPTPTLTPTATSTPTPTPTATPIPPLDLNIRWPGQVSALEPVPIEIELIPPPGIGVTATVGAVVMDPAGVPYWLFDLQPRGGHLYAAEEPLRLPFEPSEGDWRLKVYVDAALDVAGEQELTFQPVAVPLRDLSGVLPPTVDLHVPQAFAEVEARGDPVAGGRVWHYAGGEVALWWAPGPTEPLLLNNALVMLETTYEGEMEWPVVWEGEETEWWGERAFLFREEWPGSGNGPGEALVVQGPDYWLYVLRVRAWGNETISPLLRQVEQTFTFVAE